MTRGVKRIGLLGAGTVGTALAELLQRRIHACEVDAALGKVLVRDTQKARGSIPTSNLTTDAEEVLRDADIVVELIGGADLAGDLMLRALEEGKRVVTANKAALAERWGEFKPYLEAGTLYFEAAVMAGTPIIGPLTNALRGSKPLEMHALLNGTCNYILSEMEVGKDFQSALSDAQRLGYAEADPTLDIEGFDAAHKLTLLARLTVLPNLAWEEVKRRTIGISHLTDTHITEAMEDGGRVRLVGSVYPKEGAWRVEVRPAYLAASHPLAGSASNRNGLLFKGDAIGEVLITGAGAGAGPTASAVLADVLCAVAERPGPNLLTRAAALPENYDVLELGPVG